jgi:hypothetical protein
MLELASPHYKINWPTCSSVALPSSSPLNFKNSGTLYPRARELVVVVRVRFLIDMPPPLEFYTKRLPQNSSQLSREIVGIRTRLNRGSSGCHLNWLQSEWKLQRGLVIAATVIRWAVCGVPHRVVICIVRPRSM